MLCGAVLADINPLTSGVVGYGQPMFFAIGEDVTSIQNLKVIGVAEAEGSGYEIAPITSGGNIPVSYFWWGGHSGDGLPDGWYTTDDSDIIEAAIEAGTTASLLAPITMAKGEGLVTYMTKASLAVQGSGEVLSGDFTRPLNKNYTGVANPFPASVGVQSYAVTGVAEAEGSGYEISPITSGGNIPVSYFWWGGHSGDGLPDGWYTTDDSDIIEAAIEAGTTAELLADYTFTPGEAAVTYMTKTGLNLKITSPID